jgi:FkbM family methyltransferase
MNYNISQTCQISNLNEIYLKYFGYNSSGFFIEVGAYDGETVSNTSGLADIGWEGIYIEPSHEFYLKCCERHKDNNVIIQNCAIGIDEGIKSLYTSKDSSAGIGDGLLTTLDYTTAEYVSTLQNYGYPSYNVNYCFQTPLSKILQKFKVNRNFDLLVVDVEGMEDEVFASFDLNYYKPKMLIVELIDINYNFYSEKDMIKKANKVRTDILNTGYDEIYADECNTIFILQ